MRRFVLAAAATVAALATLAPEAGAQNLTNCTTAGQNRYVNDVMRDIYYWNTELPTVNTASFGSPEALLEALRFRPLDERFSYIGAQATEEAFYSDSQFIGFGFANGYDGQGLRILQVFPDSPAAETGMSRGDRITSIEGRSVVALAESGTLGDALGPSQEGVTIRFRYERPDGSAVDASMTKRAVTIPTVSHLNVYETDGRKIAYLFFRNFVTPSRAALDDAFNALRDVGATELVLDLRYNGGGLVSIAQHLASLIGGARTEGQMFAEYFHNSRNSFRNEVTCFEAKPNALPLQRLGRDHDEQFGVGQRARRQRAPAVHPGDHGRRDDVRQAGRAVRDHVLRQGAVPRVVHAAQRAGAGRLLRRHRGRLPGGRRRGPPARRRSGGVARRGADGDPHGPVLGAAGHGGTGASSRATRFEVMPPRRGLEQLIGAH